jgi:hypothetical protein
MSLFETSVENQRGLCTCTNCGFTPFDTGTTEYRLIFVLHDAAYCAELLCGVFFTGSGNLLVECLLCTVQVEYLNCCGPFVLVLRIPVYLCLSVCVLAVVVGLCTDYT